jgi:hypothetical protein
MLLDQDLLQQEQDLKRTYKYRKYHFVMIESN